MDNYDKDELRIIDDIISIRPHPNRFYDQIYMYGVDMLKQSNIVHRALDNKNVLFLGDGDGMCMLFIALYTKIYNGDQMQSATVLDFDERILNREQRFCDEISPKSAIKTCFELYNIIDPIPSRLKDKFDTFYINPPYGSKNNGESCIAWLIRALELCKSNCNGYIIIPYEENQSWTVGALQNIESFLVSKGFVIEELQSHIHRYHLKADFDLTSISMKVKRTDEIKTGFEERILPLEMVEKLYGSIRNLPHYIRDNGSVEGFWDYNWVYGDIQ